MDLMHKIAQKVEDQLDVQYHNDFSPSNVQIVKILMHFGQKMSKNRKMRFSTISRKF